MLTGELRERGELVCLTLGRFYMQLFLQNYNGAVNGGLGLIVVHSMLHNRRSPC